jgi:protein-disulfide isomerase
MENELSKKEVYDAQKEAKVNALRADGRIRLMKRLGLWVAGFIGIALLMFGLVKLGGGSETNGTASLLAAVSASDASKGNTEAPVTLIEYSDFQCPACASYYPLVKELMNEYGDRVHFVYRNFPLVQHKNAAPAALAAEAAGRQGKFWEMHDLLFENQVRWATSKEVRTIFEQYASSLKLNLEQFSADMESDEIKAKVQADYDGGIAAGVNSTPTFFLNGEKIVNPQSLNEFKALIDERAPENP